MAKREAPASVPGKPRKTDDQVREEGFTPFIRPEHTKTGEAFRVTGWNKPHADGQQYIVEIANAKGVEFSLGVRIGSPDHKILHKALGPDFMKWQGGLIVEIRQGNRGTGVGFVNVAAASKGDPF
jgi:hypothetical protein